MGLFDKFIKQDEEAVNASKLMAETAADIIKEMSGRKIASRKKIIDNVFGFTSASGGAGASTLVTNMAHVIADKGFKVIVIDMNLLYPSQGIAFDIKPEIQKKDLVSYLLGKNDLGESIENMGTISVMYANNQSLTSYLHVEEDVPLENFRHAIYKLRKLYDVVLLDIPMKVEHVMTNMAFYTVDTLYMVMDESINSVVNLEKFRKNAAFTGIASYNKIKAIMNKRTSVHYTDFIFKKLNVELVEVLPFDVEVIECNLKSKVFCRNATSSSPNADILYKKLVGLSDKILEHGGYIDGYEQTGETANQ